MIYHCSLQDKFQQLLLLEHQQLQLWHGRTLPAMHNLHHHRHRRMLSNATNLRSIINNHKLTYKVRDAGDLL